MLRSDTEEIFDHIEFDLASVSPRRNVSLNQAPDQSVSGTTKKANQVRIPLKTIEAHQVASASTQPSSERAPTSEYGDEGEERPPIKKRKNRANNGEDIENMDPETGDAIVRSTSRILKLKNCKITNVTINYNVYKND
uniref:UTP10 protein n=1 Tax=Fopius arisanus TaxID=64838 RepID=A0A0C9S0G0_9HYME